MASRRWYIATAPVEHINGKMAPVREKCRNVQTESEAEQRGYTYGYMHKSRMGVSRFAVRTRGRVLQKNPYRTPERMNRQAFADSCESAGWIVHTPSVWNIVLAEFNAQSKYVTPYGYCVAQIRLNGGDVPERWLP